MVSHNPGEGLSPRFPENPNLAKKVDNRQSQENENARKAPFSVNNKIIEIYEEE